MDLTLIRIEDEHVTEDQIEDVIWKENSMYVIVRLLGTDYKGIVATCKYYTRACRIMDVCAGAGTEYDYTIQPAHHDNSQED